MTIELEDLAVHLEKGTRRFEKPSRVKDGLKRSRSSWRVVTGA